MRKLGLGLSFVAMAVFAACGDNGSSAGDLGELSSSSDADVIGSCASGESSSSNSEEVDSSSSEFDASSSIEGSSSSVSSSSSDESIHDSDENTLADDRDGQTYRTVKIGSQTWMAENLNYAYTGVPYDYDGYTSDSTSWCYDNDPANCAKYGRLYTWAAAVGSTEAKCGYGHACGLGTGNVQGVCPKGWHLPSKEEFETLFKAVGGVKAENNRWQWQGAGKPLKSASGWQNDGNGTDSYSFSAMPTGFRYDNGTFEGDIVSFWSSTEDDGKDAYRVKMYSEDADADLDFDDKSQGFSVRCLKD